MRGAPHRGLAWLIRRIRSRIALPRLVFPAGAATSVSKTRRRLSGANRSPWQVEPCADIRASPTRSATRGSTTVGRRAGDAGDAARSFGERPAGDEGRESRPAGRHGSENWRGAELKDRPRESSSWKQL